MKFLVMLLLIVGVILVINGYNLQSMQCPPPVIRYKYIPRSFEESQEQAPRVADIFKSMFAEMTPGPV